MAAGHEVPNGLKAKLKRKLADMHPVFVVLGAAAALVAYLMLRTPVGPGEEVTAEAPDQLDMEELPIEPVNSVLLAFPELLRPSAAAAMRMKVAGTYNTGVQWPSREGEVSCMLVQHDAGQTEARIRGLLTTGRPVAIPPEAKRKLEDVADSMRMARGGRRVKFTPICLSI
jgi:hypothetical protein